MRILITGAGGMLGHDVLAAAERVGHEVVGLTRAQLDIADADAVAGATAEVAPRVVINCAAWTDVDGAEEAPEAAAAINGAGAGQVAAEAHRTGAWMIHVSSDYVFDGAKREPYVESDATAPLSAYGASKLAGERAVAAAAPERHTIVRTSWLFGVHGRCFPKTIQRLGAERDTLNIVSDQVGCPTFTGHLGPVLVGLAARPAPGVLHVAAAGQCSWFEFARAIVAASGLQCEVGPIATEQYPLPATRPAFSVLRSEREAPTLPSWRSGLTAFMTQHQRAAA